MHVPAHERCGMPLLCRLRGLISPRASRSLQMRYTPILERCERAALCASRWLPGLGALQTAVARCESPVIPHSSCNIAGQNLCSNWAVHLRERQACLGLHGTAEYQPHSFAVMDSIACCRRHTSG